MGVTSQPDPWKWVVNRVRDNVQDPNWENADLMDNIGATCPSACRRLGKCRAPLYVTRMMAKDMVDIWNLACLRSTEFNRGELGPQPHLQRNGDPDLRLLWFVVARIIGRARRPWQRANLPPLSDAQDPLTMADGTVIEAPSADEMVLEVRQGSFSLNPPFGFAY